MGGVDPGQHDVGVGADQDPDPGYAVIEGVDPGQHDVGVGAYQDPDPGCVQTGFVCAWPTQGATCVFSLTLPAPSTHQVTCRTRSGGRRSRRQAQAAWLPWRRSTSWQLTMYVRACGEGGGGEGRGGSMAALEAEHTLAAHRVRARRLPCSYRLWAGIDHRQI